MHNLPTRKQFSRCIREIADKAALSCPEKATEIHYKFRHTFRVYRHAQLLMRAENITGKHARLASLAAIAHDAGRFDQIIRHGTYDDQASENHGRTGARFWLHHPLTENLDPISRKAIVGCVNYHNRRVIPANAHPATRQVLSIVRDADKIDIVPRICRILCEEQPRMHLLKMGLSNNREKVTPSVLHSVETGEPVRFEQLQTTLDYTLFVGAWVFDLTYPFTRKRFAAMPAFNALLTRLESTSQTARAGSSLRSALLRG